MTALLLWLAYTAVTGRTPPFETLFREGLQAFQAQRWTEAEEKLAAACPLRPAEFRCWYALGAAAARQDRVDEAIRAWREAESLDGRHLRLLQLLIVEYGKGRYFQEALAAAKRALALAPLDLNVRLLAIKAAQDAADTTFGAATAATTAAKFPQSARANFEHAFYLQKSGRLAETAEYLQRAMALDPTYEEPFFFYGEVLIKSGQAEAALDYFRRAIALRPEYLPARVSLARALMTLERFEEALQVLEEAVAQDPRHPQPHLLLSQIYFRLGDETRAQRARERSLQLRRAFPTLLEAQQSRPYASPPRP